VKNTQTTMQWAAWAESCDNTARNPTRNGFRIILLYSLVVSEYLGGLLLGAPNSSKSLFTNPSRFPLYATVKNILSSPGFMKKGMLTSSFSSLHFVTLILGGRIGLYCRYPYSPAKPNFKTSSPTPFKASTWSSTASSTPSVSSPKLDLRSTLR
jgi:hypothetical protein